MRPPLAVLTTLLTALALTACGTSDASRLEEPVDLLVEDVQVVDVDAGTVAEGRSVAVVDGRIAAIWAADEVPGDLDVDRSIAGEGRWLIPGLWDAHVHFRGGEALLAENRALLPLYPANGITTVRDAGGDLTGALMAWRDSIAEGHLPGPRIYLSGPKLDGPRPSWEGSIALADPAEVPAALDSLEALGVDYVKLYDGSMSAEVFMAAVREAETRGLTVTGHMPLGVDFLEAVEAGFDGTEHLYYLFKGTRANRDEVTRRVRAGELGFWGAFWTMLDAPDPEREARVFTAMAERGTVVLPTLHIGDVLSHVEEVDHASDPELAYIPEGIRETYAGRVASARRSPPEVRANNRRLREVMAAMVEPMHAAGVTILAGSDAGPFNSFTYPGFALHAELAALVEAGLTPAEALRSATSAPADFMGVGDEVGRIAPGYRADLVLLDRNPLEEISATRSLSTVILRGEEVLDREALEALLSRVAGGVTAR
ncbi:MAG: amidohydrolase family protein [Longimicrobiales bacterium]|nr:amidohydrolase family protein [Longimicrobiales bacterium]